MSITVKSLENISFETIHAAFLEAFSDYLVNISYMTPVVMKHRFIKNGFQPNLSVGIFDDNHLKGFTVVGTGEFNGSLSAFDIMTGMVKEFRGKGLANKMFDVIKIKMKEQAINNFYLEVIQKNYAAIKAYEKTGFKKTRELNCYTLDSLQLKPAKQIQTVVYIEQADKSIIDLLKDFLDVEPSWENHFESIKRIPDKVDFFTARTNGKNIGILVYYPTLKWIMCLAVHKSHRNKGIATALLEYLAQYLLPETKDIKILNVPAKDITLNTFFLKSGCELFTRQFEMKYSIT
jgi:ribosomal protein S18 acetylase RimI-like enzyme